MNSTMDYGYTATPPRRTRPQPEPVDWRLLGQRCIKTIAVHCAIAVLGLLGLSIRQAYTVDTHLTQPGPHGVYRMTTVTPALPAVRRHVR